jgi:hypothetical protein
MVLVHTYIYLLDIIKQQKFMNDEKMINYIFIWVYTESMLTCCYCCCCCCSDIFTELFAFQEFSIYFKEFFFSYFSLWIQWFISIKQSRCWNEDKQNFIYIYTFSQNERVIIETMLPALHGRVAIPSVKERERASERDRESTPLRMEQLPLSMGQQNWH